MKSREALGRAAAFDLAEKRRKLLDMESLAGEFRRMAQDLEQQIEAEHIRTGVRDTHHFAYSSFAKAARKRRDNLLDTIADLEGKRASAAADVEAAEAELKRVHLANQRAGEERPPAGRRPNRNRTLATMASQRGA